MIGLSVCLLQAGVLFEMAERMELVFGLHGSIDCVCRNYAWYISEYTGILITGLGKNFVTCCQQRTDDNHFVALGVHAALCSTLGV